MHYSKWYLIFVFALVAGFAFNSCFHRKRAKNLYPNSVFYEPSFPGGKVAMDEFIRNHRDTNILLPDSLNFFDDSFFRMYTTFNIDTDGSIVNSHRIYDSGVYAYFHLEIDNIVKAMPKWIPAYEHNRKTGKKRPYKMITGFGVKYYYKNKKPK